MESTGEERTKVALTQEKQTSRLALLYLAQVWGNSKEKHFKGKNLERNYCTSLHGPMNTHGWISVQLAIFPARRRSAEAPTADSSRKFQDLRAMSMTRNERTQVAILHQNIRILSSRSLFSSPRRNALIRLSRRERTISRRVRHGIARSIENLRELRLSLVPRPN